VAKICLCLTANTIGRNLEILEKYRKYADVAELRVDCLDPDERFLIRRFPEQAGIPVILTIRRNEDGGRFIGGEGARISLIARGLAFAEPDKRRNFAYLEVEDDLNVPGLEEAARTFGTRIIRTWYNTKNTDADLSALIRSMSRLGDEIVKISVTANSVSDILNLFRAGKDYTKTEKILVGMGPYGTVCNILAEKFGSYLSYANSFSEPDTIPATPGLVDVQELSELYRFRNIGSSTGIFGVVGFPLEREGGTVFFNKVFRHENIDAVYTPFPSDSIDSFMELADELSVAGLSVTTPYKEAVVPFLTGQSPSVLHSGVCNTLSRCPASSTEDGSANGSANGAAVSSSASSAGWIGTNTEMQGFSDLLLQFTGRTNLKRKRVTLIGAGVMAKAAVLELYRLGAKVLILNRTLHKARDLASPYKFAWDDLGSKGVEMMGHYSDIIIKATPAGMIGTGDDPADAYPDDILKMYRFNGREIVMDFVYEPELTPFLKRAVRAGCMIISGYDMLIRQAWRQYTVFTGKEFPEYLFTRVHFGRN